jgi:Na+/proline symporter
LCCLILYPDLGVDDKKLGYVMAMKDYLPIGLKGLLIVAFLAAYMSTISTQLNWGASYLTNDLYKRFMRPESSFLNAERAQHHYVYAGRVFTVLIMLVSLYTTSVITTISGVWHFIIECGAGLGLVLILRWYWERINAWSEISATLAPFFLYWLGNYQLKLDFPWSYFFTVGGTTVIWLAVTFMTKPVKTDTLVKFCEVVKPQGWWPSFASKEGNGKKSQESSITMLGLTWLFAISMTYSILFLTGYLILQEWSAALVCFITGLVSFLLMRKMIAITGIFED